MTIKTRTRISCEERKEQIVSAVGKIFARKGLAGATTRELAKEAGVSEALLFKHYPNKKALYQASLSSCGAEAEPGMDRIKDLDASTSTLILLVHFHISHLMQLAKKPETLFRHYLRSLAEDGEFARELDKNKVLQRFLEKAGECIRAAIATGDIVDSPVPAGKRALFAARLGFIMTTNNLPPTPVMNLGSQEQLIKDVVWFVLRGIGLKEEVIKRQYNPKALTLAG